MEWIIWIDLMMFLVLLGLYIYIFTASSITLLHRIYLLLHMVFMIWPLAQFAAHTTPDPFYKMFYLTSSYAGLSLLGLAWFVFIHYLTGTVSLLQRKRLFLISIPAVSSALLAIWNPGGMFLGISSSVEFGKELQSGPLFWYMIAQSMLYVFVSYCILFYRLKREQSPRHKLVVKTAMTGILTLLFFAAVDLAINVLAPGLLNGYYPLVSIGLTVAACYIVYAITRNRVFDIIQIVQRDVMNTMSMGVIVLDEHHMIIDVNKAARSFMRLRAGDLFNEQLLAVQPNVNKRLQLLRFFAEQKRRPLERMEFEIILSQPHNEYIIVQSAPITDRRKRLIGRLITFQDVTEMRMLVEETNRQNRLLQERNHDLLNVQDKLYRANKKLEYMAVTDSLTGCYNRRYLMQQLEGEIDIHTAAGLPFAIILFDLDYFKDINDTYGHLAGDQMLVSTADLVRELLRPDDIFARYGGEEFMIYMPNTNLEQAEKLANKIRELTANNKVAVDQEMVAVTISAGLLAAGSRYLVERTKQADVKVLLRNFIHEADEALYEAKHNGRNQVAVRKL